MKEDIQVFTTPTCPYCTKVKKWLDDNGYDYEEHDVSEDKDKAREMIEKTGQRGVPQVFVDDEAIIGFQPEKIEQAINSE